MRREIIVRGEQRKDLDLERLARALLRAAREAETKRDASQASEARDGK